ncbi:MAG: 4Fe-4S dicluster domain-containing protein [Lachnospiraceae bacterium]
MKKYGMVIDVAKCTGCYNCFLACKDENCNQAHEGYTAAQPLTGQFWMNHREVERGQFPKVKISNIPFTCSHCDNPGCMNQAQDGAVYKREDGIVIIDPVKSKGQKAIVNTCPYRVIYWNEELQIPQKCDMCAHLLDKGYKEPRCVELCPTDALVFGDLNDPESEISKLVAEKKPYSAHPEYELEERVLYLNLPKNFVTATVIYKDTDQCAEGAKVTLKAEGLELTTTTDNYGDFWFEGIDNRTVCNVKIELEGYKTREIDVRVLKSLNLGDIFMEKK